MRCSAPTPPRAAASSSRAAPPTGPTAWPAATSRWSRSPATSSTASAAAKPAATTTTKAPVTTTTKAPVTTTTAAPTSSACGGVATLAKTGGGTWTCSFGDEFNDGSLDRTKWTPQKTEGSNYSSMQQDCYM